MRGFIDMKKELSKEKKQAFLKGEIIRVKHGNRTVTRCKHYIENGAKACFTCPYSDCIVNYPETETIFKQ